VNKVLLISNKVYHYRINNYNYLYHRFREDGTAFSVLTDEAQPVDFEVSVPVTVRKPSLFSTLRFIRQEKPGCIILFLHLKDRIIFPLMIYCRLSKIPVIYWNFGIDLSDPEARVKNFLYRRLHGLANAIVLYSPMERICIRPKHHAKVFVANNTINMTDAENLTVSGNILKEKFGVREKYIVLFVGRIIGAKKVDVLLRCFRDRDDIAVVIAGKGLPDELQKQIHAHANYYYLGEIKYDKAEIAKIYQAADVVCIPGNVGLAIVEAFFWGKPVVTLKREHNSPEIWYLKEGENGYIAQDEKDMELKISNLLSDRDLYQRFSVRARETALTDAHISMMYEGFRRAVASVTKGT